MRWVEGNSVSWTPVNLEAEVVGTLLVTVGSNLCGLFTVIEASQRTLDEARWRWTVVFSLSLSTSILYHVTDAIQNGVGFGQSERLPQPREE